MAENDGKLYIIVTNKLPGGMTVVPGVEESGGKKESSENIFKDYAKHSFFNMIEREAKQIISYTVANIGNFTGDYIAQTQVNNALSFLGDVGSIAIAAATGFVASGGNVAGALIGAGIAVAGRATTEGLHYYSGYLENKRQNRYIDELRTRAGLNSSNNGSRGTDY